MNNPSHIIEFLKSMKDPKQAVMNIAKNNTNPMIKNLIDMAEKGDTKGIENFARNIYKQQGRDFDKEFSDFMNNFK